MRKICLKIHRWLALPLGVFMAILCFSGLVLLIGGEIASAFDADPKQVPFLVAVKQLHRWLFMIPENPRGGLSVGRIITAVTTMCMTIVLLTGVVAWWPKSKKMLKNRLTVSTDKGFRRFVYDTHVSLGIYAFVFLFIIALTGPVFSFKWYKQGMSRLFGQETEQKEMKMEMKKDDAKQTATKEDAFAGGNAEQMKEQAQKQDGASQDMKKDGQDKKSGGKKLFKKLHTGKWGGWFSMILHAIAVLIGGFLPISGYYMWWKRNFGKKAKA